MIKHEYLKELITESQQTPDSLKVKNPLLFQIEVNGRISYILGTHHAIPLSRLPVNCLKIIASCSKCFVESKVITQMELTAYRDFFTTIFKGIPGEHIFLGLTAQQRNMLSRHFHKGISSKPIAYGMQYMPRGVSPSQVSFKLIVNFVKEALQDKVYPLLEHINADREPFEKNYTCMDYQLEDLFCEPAGGLEPNLFYSLLQVLEECTEDDVEETVKIAEMLEKLPENIDEAIEYLKTDHPGIYEDLLEATDEYSHLYLEAAYLTSFSFAKDQDDGGGYSKYMNHERNKEFFRSIMCSSKTSEQPLFAFGAMHLLGENGVLSLLTKAGVSIKKYSPDQGVFKPYHYAYLDSLFAYNRLKGQILNKVDTVRAQSLELDLNEVGQLFVCQAHI